MLPEPLGLLAELTYRCPLHCPYCSNPLELASHSDELALEDWLRVLDQARDLGVLQLHLSGGEPLQRHDLLPIVARAHERTRARVGLKGRIHVHIVGDECTAGSHSGQCAVKLETQVAPGMNAVVDKEIYLAEVGEQTWQPPPARALDVLPTPAGPFG